MDLSSPQGACVNNAIPSDSASLQYLRVDQAIKLIAQHGHGALIAKLDQQSAYRKIPVHPADQHLLGISRDRATYTDKALPFGLCLALKVVSAVADGFTLRTGCSRILEVCPLPGRLPVLVLFRQPRVSPGPPNSNPSWVRTWPPSSSRKSGGPYNVPHVSGHRSRHCESATPPATDEASSPQGYTAPLEPHQKPNEAAALVPTWHASSRSVGNPSWSDLHPGAYRQHEAPQIPRATYSAYSRSKSRYIMVAQFCR